MVGRIVFSSLLALILLLSEYDQSAADWIDDGVSYCTAPQSQYGAHMVTDTSGNSIVAWPDFRDGYWAIYAQKIDPSGNALWASDGIRLGRSICDEVVLTGPRVAVLCNEYGEAVVAWYGIVGGVTGACAQLVDPAGNLEWGPEGIVAGPGTMKNTCPAIALNSAGGVLIAWTDTRGASADVFVQNVDRSGSILWNAQGVPICTDGADQLNAVMTSDLSGGAVVGWADFRYGEWDVFAQRVSSSGLPMWASNGVAVTTDTYTQTLSYSTVVSDGKGGAIFAWRMYSGYTTYDIYSQRIDAAGNAKWGTYGVAVCDAPFTQAGAMAVSDGRGGEFVTWHDYRALNYDIYAQRVDSLGNVRWTYGGVPVCTELGSQSYPVLGTDAHGGVVIAWQDARASDVDIYAQRLDGSGEAVWNQNGARVCGAEADQILPDIACFETGDAVIGWHDFRSGNYDLYAQKVRFDGSMGSVVEEPVILAVKDVPGDEGGLLRIKLQASGNDKIAEANNPITFYNVWRKMQQPFLMAASGDPDVHGVISPSDLLESMVMERKSDGIRLSRELAAQLGFPPGEWESIGLHVARQYSVYYLTVVTLKDSTGSDPARETYIVTAHTRLPSQYFVSMPDSGYSVDNLAPGTPPGFAGRQSSAPPGLRLTWSPSPERDVAHYALYRGGSSDFVPGPGSKLLETAETCAFDGGWTSANEYFYKLSAVDRHGNESAAALLTPDEIVATLLQGFSAALREEGVELTWTVSTIGEGCTFFVLRKDRAEDAYRELSSGALVRDGLSFAYRDESCEPGETYLYRVEYAEAADRKLLFETDGVSIPPLPLTLYQNVPNPFNPSTTIRYYVPVESPVTLDVYDSTGRHVNRLIDREMKPRGMHQIQWSGRDTEGDGVASGIYFYRLQSGKKTISRKMVLLK
jgi:hypothetical protein